MADALRRAEVPLFFASGLDTKTDPVQTPLASLQTLENAVFTRPGALLKRSGNKALPTEIANSAISRTNITTGRALMAYGNELLACDDRRLYSYDKGSLNWIDRAPFVSVIPTQTPIVRNLYKQSQQDGARHASGLEIYAWEDSSGGVRYSVRDSGTGQFVVSSTLISATGKKPKCVAVGNWLVVLYVETSGTAPVLNGAFVPVGTPSTTPAIHGMTGGSGSDRLQINPTTYSYDATVITSTSLNPQLTNLYVVFFNDGAPNPGYTVTAFDSGAPWILVQQYESPLSVNVQAITIFGDGEKPVLAFSDDASTVLCYSFTFFQAGVTPTRTLVGTISVGSLLKLLTGASRDGAGSGNFDLFVTLHDPAGSTLDAVTSTVPSTAGVLGATLTKLTRSAGLAGKAFAVDGRTYAPLVYESPLNSTYFLVDSGGQIVARVLSGNAGGMPVSSVGGQYSCLAESSSTGTSQFLSALLFKDFLTTLPVTTTAATTTFTYTQTGVTAINWDLSAPVSAYLSATAAGALQINGGALFEYDGAALAETGFHVYPEPTAAQLVTSNTGGSLGNALATTYWWVFTYEWTDNQGMVHRSTPSAPLSASFNAGTTTGKATWTLPTLRLTSKAAASPVTINAYRTQGVTPGVYYLAATTVVPAASPATNAPVINDSTVDTVTFIDTMSDTALIGEPRLYSTGAVLENEPPPPFSALALFQARLWGIDSTNPLTLWFSQEIVPGTPVQFSSYLTLNLDPSLVAASALGIVDGNLVVFGETSVVAISGVGPDSTGANNQYQAVPVRTEVGCTNPRSVVGVRDGIQFQSKKGIWLLDRSLVGTYLGAPVEGLTSGATVKSALLLPTTTQVRFATDTSGVLLYDSYVGQWSNFPTVKAVQAVVWDDLFTYLRSDGKVLYEAAGTWTDDGTPVVMNVVTGPIRPHDPTIMQRMIRAPGGMIRIREVVVVGTYKSAHTLNVSLYYDGSPSPDETVAVVPIDPTTFGSDLLWGLSSPWGGGYTPYIWRVQCGRQKCESIRVGISDAEANGSPGEGMSLSSLLVVLGVQDASPYRLPVAG